MRGPEIKFEISRGSFYAIRLLAKSENVHLIKKRAPKMNAYLKLNICLSRTHIPTSKDTYVLLRFVLSTSSSQLVQCSVLVVFFLLTSFFRPELSRPALNYILFMLMPDKKCALSHT